MTSKVSIFLVGVILTGLAFATHSELQKAKEKYKEENTFGFKAGQILYPDYCHHDTLVVVDPIGLNEALRKVDGSDYEIAGALYRHCVPLGWERPEYGLDIDYDGYHLYDYANEEKPF